MVPHDEPGLSTPDDQSPHILTSRSIGHVDTSLDPIPILQFGVSWGIVYSNLEYVKREVGMEDQLTTTSYAVLAQVAVRPWSTYELVQQRVRYFRYVWPRAESAIYREAKRLSSMGLIEGKKEYIGKRARTVYSITEDGKEALREWMGTPISAFSMNFEAILRIFAAPLGTKEEIIRTVEQVRADTQEMLQFAGEVKQEFIDGINVTQDQVYIRALPVDFFIS